MRHPTRTGLIALGSAIATTAVVGVAFAAGPDVPEGPSIDFCPTTEQIEAHLDKYGFDYKPTVVCGENGEELGPASPDGEEVSESALLAAEKEKLLKAKRGAEVDGDPRTLEVVYADGTESVIIIQTDDPKFWEGMTPAEFAEIAYP